MIVARVAPVLRQSLAIVAGPDSFDGGGLLSYNYAIAETLDAAIKLLEGVFNG